MNKTDYKDMWVFIERDGDSVLPVSLELCSETRRLCDASGEKLVAVIVGSISDGELQRVLDCGVDKVIHVTGTGYDYFNNDAYTNLFTVLCRKYRPTAVMVGGTINGRDFAPRFAARLGTGCTSDATELVWDPKTTDIEFVEPAVGGKMMAVITVPVARPQVGTIRPGTFKCVPCGARAHEVIEEPRCAWPVKTAAVNTLPIFRTSRTLMAVSRAWSNCSRRRLRRRTLWRCRSPRGRTACRML